MSTVRPGGPSFAEDSKRVRITIGNGSRVEAMRGHLVSERTNWITLGYTELYGVPHPAAEKDKRRDRYTAKTKLLG